MDISSLRSSTALLPALIETGGRQERAFGERAYARSARRVRQESYFAEEVDVLQNLDAPSRAGDDIKTCRRRRLHAP